MSSSKHPGARAGTHSSSIRGAAVAYFCVPSLLNGTFSVNVKVSGGGDSASEAAARSIGDLLVAWPVILVSAFVAIIVSFGYTFFLEK